MSVKDEYLAYKQLNNLRTNNFNDRVLLQHFLRERLNEIWYEKPSFTNGGLFTNHMTDYALGFAYYDCRPSHFCKSRCYGLPIAGINDYYMLRLAVLTSEALKAEDYRYIEPLLDKIKTLKFLKIGHWGDAVLEQVPVIVKLVKKNPNTLFWWYTKKIEIASEANEYNLPNLRAYLSLDPTTDYPSMQDYPYGFTYLLGDKQLHKFNKRILRDDRLTALFVMKKNMNIEDPAEYGIENHPKLCMEKKYHSKKRKIAFCLHCTDRCNYRK